MELGALVAHALLASAQRAEVLCVGDKGGRWKGQKVSVSAASVKILQDTASSDAYSPAVLGVTSAKSSNSILPVSLPPMSTSKNTVGWGRKVSWVRDRVQIWVGKRITYILHVQAALAETSQAARPDEAPKAQSTAQHCRQHKDQECGVHGAMPCSIALLCGEIRKCAIYRTPLSFFPGHRSSFVCVYICHCRTDAWAVHFAHANA